MSGAPVELDKHLGGVIASLRERGEFAGDQLETFLLIPPKDSIKAKALLLVGLGDEDALSLKLMEAGRPGLSAGGDAARGGAGSRSHRSSATRGTRSSATGDVETAVVRGMLLAYDTEQRLQKEGLAKAYTLEEWWVEAGPCLLRRDRRRREEGVRGGERPHQGTANRSPTRPGSGDGAPWPK